MLDFFITWGVATLLTLSFFVYVILVVAQEGVHPRVALSAYSKNGKIAIITTLIVVLLAMLSAVITRLAELS